MAVELKKKQWWKIIVLWFYAVLLFLMLFAFLEILLVLPAAIEQAHRKEARSNIVQMHYACEYFFFEDGNTRRCTAENLGIDVPGKGMPGTCGQSQVFSYSVQDIGNSTVACTATRCSRGRSVQDKKPFHLTLTTDYKCEAGDSCDIWNSD